MVMGSQVMATVMRRFVKVMLGYALRQVRVQAMVRAGVLRVIFARVRELPDGRTVPVLLPWDHGGRDVRRDGGRGHRRRLIRCHGFIEACGQVGSQGRPGLELLVRSRGVHHGRMQGAAALAHDYVEASKVFYNRGAIQPKQMPTTPEYAWGSCIYFWVENQKEGSTCHKEALRGDFGGTLNNINSGLECLAYKGG